MSEATRRLRATTRWTALTGTTDALGDRTTYTYDAAGHLTVVRAPLSRTTTFAYDAMDRLDRRHRPAREHDQLRL